ncbi:MAG TPA: DNA topoisomerase IV subunit A, partial [Minicystis sp.]|nr:DNA topoisomerase IV subunit A [Minicystis sp.]
APRPQAGGGDAPPPRRRGGGGEPPAPPPIADASLAEEAQRRYLNYALSVITSRALPDVRDGLKPVQRRILYTMQNDLRLGGDAKPKKSARVVGDAMGRYHPHGDVAIYDAMVRMAQAWVMRVPLVDGHGNFGSIDGDAPAAMRYTEARLLPVADELLGELGRRTVAWRPNYDGSSSEPVVLPARFPNLLVNGSQGIAVGMATSIPPHNLGEVIDAAVALVDDRELTVKQLLKHLKGPDFPTGGELLATPEERRAVYETGSGSLKLRGEWRSEGDDGKRGSTPQIVVTSIPYAVERKTIVEKVAEVILSKKLAGLVDVRDESTAEIRIVLELKKGADPQLVMAYLFKNTPLAVNVQVNLTCLVPTADPEIAAPRRLGLREMLLQFLDFRFETVTKRLEFELGELQKRIHLLEGFELVFDALDEVIRIIRRSEDRADAKAKLMKRFGLSEEQTDAILELRLYRLAKLEILVVQKELAEKRAEAKRIEGLLKSPAKRWAVVKDELLDIKKKYADKRRTRLAASTDEPEFQAEDFIVAEDAHVVLSAQGWVKRLRELKDPSATRLRDGDAVLAAVAGSTRASVAFFSNLGGCYVCRIHDVPPSTGYGDPVQKLFKLADGERMIAMLSFDPRALDTPAPTEGAAEPEPPFAIAVTRGGLGFRFSLRPHREPSTRAGRRFARLNEGDEVLAVMPTGADDAVVCAVSDGHVLGVKVDEIAVLSGAGKGAMVIKVHEGERVVGAGLALAARDTVTIETEKGKTMDVTLQSVLGSRADRGSQLVKRDRFVRVVPPPVVAPSLEVS